MKNDDARNHEYENELPNPSKSESRITIRISIALSQRIDYEACSNPYKWRGSVDVNFWLSLREWHNSPRPNKVLYICAGPSGRAV